MAMASMKMSKKEAKECMAVCDADAPQYPYGLCISLDNDSLEKLGLKSLPAVGAVVTIQAKATITSTSSNSTQGGEESKHASLQITDMEVSTDDGKTSAQRMYSQSSMNP